MKKLLRYIFIPVLAILLMSHNVSAVEMSPNVHPIWTNATPDCTFYTPDGSTFYNDLFNGTTNFLSVSYISCGVPAGLQSKNTYAVYSFVLDNIPNNDSLDAGFRAVKARHGSGGNGGWGVVGYNLQSLSSNGVKIDIYLYGENNNTSAGTVIFYNSYNSSELLYFQPKERLTTSGASYWQVDTTDFEYNYTDVLNQINSKLGNVNTGITNIRDGVNSINEKLDDLSQDTADAINNGQADATQGASDNSSTAADNNSTDQTTSNLLGVFGSFVTAITSISPSNCNVDFDLGHIDFGVQNLCSQPVPQAFTVVTSIIVVCFTIPFVVHLIRRILSLIREMQT